MYETYQVKLDAFEGPLDLLLHLINQYEIDIYDIPVSEITEQYMHYIHTMQQLELNVASEYLVMAATLLAIKSSLLLPNQELDIEEEYEEDPREELMRRLIEYRKYKEAAQQLQEKESDASYSFTRAAQAFSFDKTDKPVTKGEVSIYDMLSAMQKVFERKKWSRPLETTVQRTEIPVKQRMEDVLTQLRHNKYGISFDELFDYPSRSYIVVTFIAILELMKNNQVYCTQEHHLDTLIIYNMEDNT
ncbi:segregation and condensation protein A [Paraliobacillus quinghaiensis]|uniref:Segregation and condensation protein A n=1 Tax=Paraliobacillus quinghaiensis TaxID=470815 RepID=A0A917TGZ6_9BACI|nr:segregation/condensation protein A [Paraliobacillus quinghaiensis]GGM22504.1 segregation and condensation protein A [Paraliobacillus quinghaiensis]